MTYFLYYKIVINLGEFNMGKKIKLDEIMKSKRIESWDELGSPLKAIVLGPDKGEGALKRVEKIYRISNYLLEDSRNKNKLYIVKDYAALETKIKTGIKYAIKTGIYAVLLNYTPRDEEFNQPPKFRIDLLNLYSSGRSNRETVLNITFYAGPKKDYSYKTDIERSYKTDIERYYPGDWEEILEKRYKEALEEHAKKSSGAGEDESGLKY